MQKRLFTFTLLFLTCFGLVIGSKLATIVPTANLVSTNSTLSSLWDGNISLQTPNWIVQQKPIQTETLFPAELDLNPALSSALDLFSQITSEDFDPIELF